MTDHGGGDSAGQAIVEGPDGEGFTRYLYADGRFNDIYRGVLARQEGAALSRVRVATDRDRTNNGDTLHGGFMLAFLDHAIFMGPIAAGRLPLNGPSLTLNLSTQFLAPGHAGEALDCVVEIVRETGRLMFLRGQLEQRGRVLLTYQATLRKVKMAAD